MNIEQDISRSRFREGRAAVVFHLLRAEDHYDADDADKVLEDLDTAVDDLVRMRNAIEAQLPPIAPGEDRDYEEWPEQPLLVECDQRGIDVKAILIRRLHAYDRQYRGE